MPVNKKVEMWQRRWKRAKEILEAQDVELRTWHKGQDICLDAVKLVERNMREMGIGDYDRKGRGGDVKVKDFKK